MAQTYNCVASSNVVEECCSDIICSNFVPTVAKTWALLATWQMDARICTTHREEDPPCLQCLRLRLRQSKLRSAKPTAFAKTFAGSFPAKKVPTAL
eukprot:6290734-Amphidinium_carterae.1